MKPKLELRLLSVAALGLILLFTVTEKSKASVESYGNIQSELTYAELINGEMENTLVNNISFNSNLKLSTDKTSGFLNLKGDYENDELTLSLNKAYISYQNDSLAFEIGKDRFLKGVGFGWNPSDLMNPSKSPLYREEEKRGEDVGINLASVSYFGDKGSLVYEISAVVIPGESYSDMKKVLLTKLINGSFEWFFIGGFQTGQKNIYGGYFRASIPYFDKATMYGEFQSTEFQSNNKHLLGVQLNPEISLLRGSLQFQAEYFYNQSGCKNMSEYFIKNPNAIPVLGESLQHYYYTGSVYNDISSRFFFGVIWNADEDKSGVVNFLYSKFISKECLFKIGGYSCFFSDSEKEFAKLTNTRLTIYAGLSIYFNVSNTSE